MRLTQADAKAGKISAKKVRFSFFSFWRRKFAVVSIEEAPRALPRPYLHTEIASNFCARYGTGESASEGGGLSWAGRLAGIMWRLGEEE